MKLAPFKMEEVPIEKWPKIQGSNSGDPIKVFKNSRYLVQVRKHRGQIRLSINRVQHTFREGKPIWLDGLTWDELQEIKNQCGFEDYWLCEYYPPKEEVVNIANIRHLWVIPMPENRLNNPTE